MLWLATSKCSEHSEDKQWAVRWHQNTGFGWWVAEAWYQDRLLEPFTNYEFEVARQAARKFCEVQSEAGG